MPISRPFIRARSRFLDPSLEQTRTFSTVQYRKVSRIDDEIKKKAQNRENEANDNKKEPLVQILCEIRASSQKNDPSEPSIPVLKT